MEDKMYSNTLTRLCAVCTLTIFAVLAFCTLGMAQAYQQSNLVSDIQGLAPITDGHLLNPWGLIASSTSPFWVSDNNGGVSTLYNGNTGAIVPLVVNIPPLDAKGNGTGTPTGIAFTGAAGFTFKANGKMATSAFTFVTEDGTIVAWGPAINPNDLPHDAFVVVDNSTNPTAATGAVYKGATIAQMTAGGPFFLYVTNIRAGRIEVYDANFNPVNLRGDDDGGPAFVDHEIPDG